MYKLLIVDDEFHAVRAIESSLDWMSIGITSVFTAYNISKAKKIMESQTVDLILTDIEMPRGSGLDFLRWVREAGYEAEAVFITCHSEFDYAKQAVSLGSLDYLLKPVNHEDLKSVLHKAVEKIVTRKNAKTFNDRYQYYYNLWSRSKPMIINSFWTDLLTKEIPSKFQQIQQELLRYGLTYSDIMNFTPIFIKVRRFHKKLTVGEQKILEYGIGQMACEMISQEHVESILFVQLRIGEIVVLLESKKRNLKIYKDVSSLIDKVSDYFYCDLNGYIGEGVRINEVSKMTEKLFELDYHTTSRINKAIDIGELPLKKEKQSPVDMTGWEKLLEHEGKEKIIHEIYHYLKQAVDKKAVSPDWLQQFFQDFLQKIYYVMQIKGLEAHLILADEDLEQERAVATRSVTDLKIWIESIVNIMVEKMKEVDGSQSVVEKAKHFISMNLEHSLSREEIANQVYLNGDYLSRLFKKETGYSISEFIFKERMEIAKKMLETTNVHMSIIADSVGYGSYSHFSKMFKKATGLSPQEYRILVSEE